MKFYQLFLILCLLLVRCAGDEVYALTATASAVVVAPSQAQVQHNPDDLVEIARLKHAINSMLQKGCVP